MARFQFVVNQPYKRSDVKRAVGADPSATGGAWDTGYVTYGGADFIFCGVGTAGRTGHDYDNHFDGDELVWSGKTGSRKGQPTIARMTDPNAEVHIFWRESDREPFVYGGLGTALSVSDSVPVIVRWRLRSAFGSSGGEGEGAGAPETTFPEGALKRVVVNAYERNPQARRACIRHHGTACKVCGMRFEDEYGSVGVGFIHVHHLKQLSTVGKSYVVDPVNDLLPVCPNCHAMLHTEEPPMSVERLRAALAASPNGLRRKQSSER